MRVLGQIDAPGSSRALAMLALSSKSAEVAAEAMQIFAQRDPRDFAPMLIAMIRDPIKYEVKPVNGPGKAGELVIKDGTTNRKRLYTPQSEPQMRHCSRTIESPSTRRRTPRHLAVRRSVCTGLLQRPLTPPEVLATMSGSLLRANRRPDRRDLEKAGLSAAQSQKLGNVMATNAASSVPVLN